LIHFYKSFSQNMATRLPFNSLAVDPGGSRLPRRHSSSVAYNRDTIRENKETGALRIEGRRRRRQGSVTWDLTTQVYISQPEPFVDQFDQFLYQSLHISEPVLLPPSEVDPIIRPEFHLAPNLHQLPSHFPTSCQQRRLSLGSALTSSQPRTHRLRSFALHGKRLVRKGEAVVESGESPTASTGSLCSGSPPVSSRRCSHAIIPPCLSTPSSPGLRPRGEVFRVLILGAAGVGKTSLCSQFLSSANTSSYEPDCESVEKEVAVSINNQETRLVFIDHTHGEISTEQQLGHYLPAACLVLFAVDDKSSLEQAKRILAYLHLSGSLQTCPTILVANKTDLVRNRQVKGGTGKEVATNYQIKYIETSPGINHNVDELLVGLVTQIHLRRREASSKSASCKVGRGLFQRLLRFGSVGEWGASSSSCTNLNTP